MKEIELTEKEIALIKEDLTDQGYFAKKGEMVMLVNRKRSEEDQRILDELVDRALDAEQERDASDEVDKVWNCEILLWYYMKWLEQGHEDTIGLKKGKK